MSDTTNKTTTAMSAPQSSGGLLGQALGDKPIGRYVNVITPVPETPKENLSEVAKKDEEKSEKLIEETKQKLEEIKSQNNPINLPPVQNAGSSPTVK